MCPISLTLVFLHVSLQRHEQTFVAKDGEKFLLRCTFHRDISELCTLDSYLSSIRRFSI